MGSWTDIFSDFIGNNRTLATMNIAVLHLYGYVFFYGVGFGHYLLSFDLPSDSKACGRNDFLATLEEYHLNIDGISGLLQRASSTQQQWGKMQLF